MIQKNLKGLERTEIFIASHVKVFLGDKYNTYGNRTIASRIIAPQKIASPVIAPR